MSVTCMSLVWSMLLCLYWSACLCHLFDVQVFPERWRSVAHQFSIRRGVQGLKVSSSSIKIRLIFVQILYICPFLPFFFLSDNELQITSVIRMRSAGIDLILII